LLPAFREGLKETGFVEGENLNIEFRWADGQYDKLPAMAAELVQRRVAVVAVASTIATMAAKQATQTIPIVFFQVATRSSSVLFQAFIDRVETLQGQVFLPTS
jgi:putative ABC transport system substrate-binding protein